MNDPKVAIIVLNWNGISDTKACLNSLKKITYKNYKVILVDNGSRYDEAHFLEKEFGDYVHLLIKNEQNLGFTGGNNCAIKKALSEDFDYIFLLNNDTEVEPDFLTKLVAFAEKEEKYGIVGPTITNYKDKNIIWSAGGRYWWWVSRTFLPLQGENVSKIKKGNYKVDYISGCAILIKRKIVEEIGLLDEKFFSYQEDADFCIRAKSRGWESWQIPSSIIRHKIFKKFKKVSANQVYLLTRNKLWLSRKNFDRLRFHLVFFIWIFWKIPVKFAQMIIYREERGFFKAHLKGLIDGACYRRKYINKD